MGEQSDIWYLENINLFDFLCPSKLSGFDRSSVETVYKKGEFVFFPDEISDRIFFLTKGRIRIGSYSSNGKEILKSILVTGEVFGELSLAGEGKRKDFAQAMEDDTEVCSMNLQDIQELMRENKDFSLKITRIMGLRLIRTERRLEALVFKDAKTRVVEYLEDLAKDRGRQVGDEIAVDHFLTHKDIASLTGTSRQTVTTILNDLRERNLIYFDRKRLLIRSLERLLVDS